MIDQIPINFYASVFQAYVHPDTVQWMTFAEIAELFEQNQTLLQDKTTGILFNCCSWISDPEPPVVNGEPVPGLIRRCRQNVERIYCMLLDVDGTQTLAETINIWADYEFIVYSTHGNSQEREKFRLILPLQTPLTRLEFDQRHEAMVNQFGVDGASFTISQAFYLPSHSSANSDLAYVFWNQSADRYDALTLPTTEIREAITAPVLQPGQRSPEALSIYRTLITGGNLHYNDVLALAVLCKANGITQSEFEGIVAQTASPDSILRTNDVDIGDMYRQGYQSRMTRRKMIGLMTRMGCDMWRWGTAD